MLTVAGALALAVLGSAASGPTYNRDVAPILDAKCASCHRLGGIAPFSLTTAADAKAHAAGIERMTKAGLVATAFYVAVVVLFYELFSVVNSRVRRFRR